MNHYTYIIQSNTTSMRYIGVRSCKCDPVKDTSYWGSSKHLPKDVTITHTKLIIKQFSTRREAVEHEVYLHRVNNVALSGEFYNKANQKTSGFDTSGTKLGSPSELHRQRLSESNKRYASKPGYVNPRKGVTLSEETKSKLSKSIKDSRSKKSPAQASPRFKPWFIEWRGTRQEFFDKTKQEYALEMDETPARFRDLATKSKGITPITKGKYSGMIIGNI